MVLYVGGQVSYGGGLGALMGCHARDCHGAATGLPRGCHGATTGLSWGACEDFMRLSWGSHAAPMGLSWSFLAAPDGAVMKFLCGFYGPLVWVVWECRYVGCILGVVSLCFEGRVGGAELGTASTRRACTFSRGEMRRGWVGEAATAFLRRVNGHSDCAARGEERRR